MKKLLIMSILLYALSCNNPEDRATGNPDSTNFNQDARKNLNTATDFDKTQTDTPDTSTSPATSKENVRSKTNGTNRSYGTGQDSSKQK